MDEEGRHSALVSVAILFSMANRGRISSGQLGKGTPRKKTSCASLAPSFLNQMPFD